MFWPRCVADTKHAKVDSVCAGDDYNTTQTVASRHHGDNTSGEHSITYRAFPVYALGM